MKIFFICMLMTFISTFNALAIKDTRVVTIAIVNSYNLEHPCTGPQNIGFMNRLAQILDEANDDNNFKYPHRYQFITRTYDMFTKTKYISPSDMSDRARSVMKWIDTINPDIIYTTDDNAFRYVGLPISNKVNNKGNKYIVIYSGINRPFDKYIKLCDAGGKTNILGTEEVINFLGVLKLLDTTNMVFNKIYMLVDDSSNCSPTSRYIAEQLLRQVKDTKFDGHVQTIEIPNKRHLISVIRRLNNKPLGILFIATQRVYDATLSKMIDKNVIIDTIYENNTKHFELVVNPNFVKRGMCMSVAVSFKDMGRTAGDIVSNILIDDLKLNTKVNVISTAPKSTINMKRFRKLKFYSILEDIMLKVDKVY